MNDTKYLIVKGNAGLGNRMLCAVTGILYSRLMGRRLIIDWSDGAYTNDRSNSFHELFRIRDDDESLDVPNTDSVYPSIWRGHMHSSAAEMIRDFDPTKFSSPTIHRKYSADLSRIHYDEEVLMMWAFSHQIRRLRGHFKGEWGRLREMSNDAIVREVLRKDLHPHPRVTDAVNAFAAANFAGPMIGVHIRYTDQVGSLNAYIRRVSKLLDCEPRARVFLATDNRIVTDEFTKRFGSPVQTEKWFPPPGECMHQNDACPDRLQNAIDALIDMYLLARCNYLVYARRSTFSRVAFLLSKMDSQNVYDTERLRLDIRTHMLIWARLM